MCLLLTSGLVTAAQRLEMAWECGNTADGSWVCNGVPKQADVMATPKAIPKSAEIVEVPLRGQDPKVPAVAETPPEKPAEPATAEIAKPASEPPATARAAATPEPQATETAEPIVTEPPATEVEKPASKAVAETPLAEKPVLREQKPAPVHVAREATSRTPVSKGIDYLGRKSVVNNKWELCATPASAPPLPGSSSQATELTADQVELVKQGISTFKGNVKISQPGRMLHAEEIQYDKQANTVEASGNVTYTDGNISITGESTRLNLDTDKGDFKNAEYRLFAKHGRGKAAIIRKDKPNILNMEQVTYTTCEPNKKDWELKVDTMELDTARNIGVARNVTLRFMDVPIFYTPYMSFPLSDERKSGFLTPSFGTKNDSGAFVKAPYYFNIAPNRDATLTPAIYQNRGLQLAGEYRYLGSKYKGFLRGEYLPSDNERNNNNRSALIVRHNQRLTDRWSAALDINRVSDNDYFDDFSNSLSVSSITHLPGRGSISYSGDYWNFSGRVDKYQTIDPTILKMNKPYDRLPQLTLNAYYPDQYLGLSYALSSELVYFDRDNSVTGSRFDLLPSISLPLRSPWGYITPKLSIRHTRYNLSGQGAGRDDTQSRTLPIFSVDSGIYLESDRNLFGNSFTQTLEPRAYYLNVPYKDQSGLIVDKNNNSVVFDTSEFDFTFASLFREDRFSGADRVGDANQLTLALTSRLLEPGTGYERLRASIGQIYYFRDRDVTLPGNASRNSSSSDIVAELASRLNNAWTANFAYQYDTEDEKTDKSVAQVRYKPDRKHILNVAYRYDKDLLEQTDVSARWPMTDNLYAVGRWNYSLRNNNTLEGFAGIEYDNCCWALRLVGRRRIKSADFINDNPDYNSAVYVQIEFKGLTNFGNKVDKLLENGILGYETN